MTVTQNDKKAQIENTNKIDYFIYRKLFLIRAQYNFFNGILVIFSRDLMR